MSMHQNLYRMMLLRAMALHLTQLLCVHTSAAAVHASLRRPAPGWQAPSAPLCRRCILGLGRCMVLSWQICVQKWRRHLWMASEAVTQRQGGYA